MNTIAVADRRVEVSAESGVVGVRTTGIYCRPECRPGRSPRPENCVQFRGASEARAAGFRPCKKCRPDAGPLETIRFGQASTPIGQVFVAVSEQGLCALYLLDGEDAEMAANRLRHAFPKAKLVEDNERTTTFLKRAVAHVLHGESIDDIALDLRGTEFQRRVWEALRSIPRGTTTSYGALTRSLGLKTGAARAVGSACGANPVSLIVPCHRVLSTGGGLGGYYWGVERKQSLLEAEGVETK